MSNLPVTIALISYNQQQFIEDSVRSVLAQNYNQLQIILSDDASTDSTFEKMKQIGETYSGTSDLIIRQSAGNRGIAQHVNDVVALATGDVIVLCAGDDIATSSRASMSADYFSRSENLSALSFSVDVINEDGVLVAEHKPRADELIDRFSFRKKKSRHPNGASRTYHRRVFDVFGPLNPQCPTEDTPLLLRSMMIGDVAISGRVGIKYRKHSRNLSDPQSIAQMNVNEIFTQYKDDIEFAKINNIMSDQDFKKLESAVLLYIQRRKFNHWNKQIKAFFHGLFG